MSACRTRPNLDIQRRRRVGELLALRGLRVALDGRARLDDLRGHVAHRPRFGREIELHDEWLGLLAEAELRRHEGEPVHAAALASRWRDASADALESCFGAGLIVGAFDRERSAYVLVPVADA